MSVSVQTNGYYESEEKDQTPHLIRFHVDGTVRGAHNPIALAETTAAKGTGATLLGVKLNFTTQHRFGQVAYDCEVAKNGKINANIVSKITGWKGKLTFHFVPDK